MKTLFLVWHRSGQNIPGYFEFEPYLYGPYSLEVYRVLDELTQQELIIQPPQAPQRWADHYLTTRGKEKAEEAVKSTDAKMRKLVEHVAQEVSQLGFRELLRNVYSEAPEFAANSLVKEVVQK